MEAESQGIVSSETDRLLPSRINTETIDETSPRQNYIESSQFETAVDIISDNTSLACPQHLPTISNFQLSFNEGLILIFCFTQMDNGDLDLTLENLISLKDKLKHHRASFCPQIEAFFITACDFRDIPSLHHVQETMKFIQTRINTVSNVWIFVSPEFVALYRKMCGTDQSSTPSFVLSVNESIILTYSVIFGFLIFQKTKLNNLLSLLQVLSQHRILFSPEIQLDYINLSQTLSENQSQLAAEILLSLIEKGKALGDSWSPLSPELFSVLPHLPNRSKQNLQLRFKPPTNPQNLGSAQIRIMPRLPTQTIPIIFGFSAAVLVAMAISFFILKAVFSGSSYH